MSARAFESYVIAKLADQGAANDYLANVVTEQAFRNEQSIRTPPPPRLRPSGPRSIVSFRLWNRCRVRTAGLPWKAAAKVAAAWMLAKPSARPTRSWASCPARPSCVCPWWKASTRSPRGGPSALAEGAYYPAGDGGRIYLVADNLPTAARLQQVLAHEVVGHFGVEALLGERFRDVLADVRRLARAPDGAHIPRRAGPEHPHYATFEAVTARYPDYSTENRAREVLARMAEQGKRPIFLDRLYGMIRAALRRLGFSCS